MTRLALLLTVAVLACGCTTVRQSFPGYSAPDVWTALQAVARSPDYDDPDVQRRWSVEENAVWVDPTTRRIEIYRTLARRVHLPRAEPRREDRTWRFQVTLESVDPMPKAVFVSRGWGAPSDAREEGNRYFTDVLEMLGSPSPDATPAASPPTTPNPEPPAPREPAPASPSPMDNLQEIGDAPPVDIGDLTPGG